MIAYIYKQTLGVWTFELGEGNYDNTLSCGYSVPDSSLSHFTHYDYKLKVASTLVITLSEPNIATIATTGATGIFPSSMLHIYYFFSDYAGVGKARSALVIF